MPLNYLKRFRYTLRLKFGPFIPSPSNFWSTYALLSVSWPTRNIQLILLLFKCQMDFPRHFYVLSLDIYIQGKRVKYAPKLFERSRYTPVQSLVNLCPRVQTFGLHMPLWMLVGQFEISNSFYFSLNVKWIFHIIFIYYYLTFILKEKGVFYAPNYPT